MIFIYTLLPRRNVAPFAGAWIEIEKRCKWRSHNIVAPFAGAWIEMTFAFTDLRLELVAPFAGAWIEIFRKKSNPRYAPSLPSRERGLKLYRFRTPLPIA